jgi:hypothetical protein
MRLCMQNSAKISPMYNAKHQIIHEGKVSWSYKPRSIFDIYPTTANLSSPRLLVIWYSGYQREREKPLLTWSNTVALAHRQYTVYNTIHSYCPQEESCVGHTTHWLLPLHSTLVLKDVCSYSLSLFVHSFSIYCAADGSIEILVQEYAHTHTQTHTIPVNQDALK